MSVLENPCRLITVLSFSALNTLKDSFVPQTGFVSLIGRRVLVTLGNFARRKMKSPAAMGFVWSSRDFSQGMRNHLGQQLSLDLPWHWFCFAEKSLKREIVVEYGTGYLWSIPQNLDNWT